MNRNRAELVLLVLSAAVLAAGCVGSQQTGASGGASASIVAGMPASTASATASVSTMASGTTAPLRPSLSPADAAAVDRATLVIRALGGSVSPDARVSVLGLGSDGTPATVVALGAWLVQWNPSGRLTFVVDVLPPYAPTPDGALSEAGARTRVADVLSRLGITLGAPTSFLWENVSSDDWRAHWDRTLDGFPVPSDGTMVVIRPDGVFEAYGYAEAPNAPAPATRISQSQAVAKAGRCRNIPNGPNGLVETCTVSLEWHTPQPAQEQGSLLRLCWTISTFWDDNDQNYGGGRVWLDAGTGEVLDSTAIA
jgi:hypothetical protein